MRMAHQPRILTFNFHEPYLCLMAKTGWHFYVGQYANPPLARRWQTQYRAIPANMTLLDEPTWRRDLMAGRFDVAIAHNETNAIDVFHAPCGKILVCHNRRDFVTSQSSTEGKRQFSDLLEQLRQRFMFVFISESKQADYGIPGKIILPGIDVDEFGGYRGDKAEILRVGNMMRERNLMFDVEFQQRACRGLPNRVVGDNPTIRGAASAASFDELLELFRSMRCLLHVSREEWEDGYNLSMLEAMACGMPVVALANKSSPITDEVDGFVSYDADVLHSRLKDLLEDVDMARRIGARGRGTVAKKFPIRAFVDNWKEAVEVAAEHSSRRPLRASRRTGHTARHNVLVHHMASPITTGQYITMALRKTHNVLTAGYRCPEDLLRSWGFDDAMPEYKAQDIDLPYETDCKQLRDNIPESFRPDFYLWIDAGLKGPPPGLADLDMPKVCYLIDTHVKLAPRLSIARYFDFVFMAQKAQLEQFRRAGIPNVFWLPLACSPELHEAKGAERTYDVAFVGAVEGSHNVRRQNLKQMISGKYPNSRFGRAWPHEMADIYARSKIVINPCANRDVNMRVFEVLASGALLITEDAYGLDDLFEDGKHLVVYHDDAELLDLIDHYLDDDEARESIAQSGREAVYQSHTYDHRVARIFRTLAESEKRDTNGDVPAELTRYQPSMFKALAQRVPQGSRRVLDIDCGVGELGSELDTCGVQGIVGIENNPDDCRLAKQVMNCVVNGDITGDAIPFAPGVFDCLVMGHGFERLSDPVTTLKKLGELLSETGIIMFSVPNAAGYLEIEALVQGHGTRERRSRAWTRRELSDTIESAGLETLLVGPLIAADERVVPRNVDGSVSVRGARIGPVDDARFTDLATCRYLVVAGRPGADRLEAARAHLDARQNQAALVMAAQAYGVDELERKRIMAIAHGRLNNLAEAERLYIEILDQTSDRADIKGELGILYVALSRYDQATQYLEVALAADPDSDRVAGALGLVRLSQGRVEDAYKLFRRALESGFEHRALIHHYVQTATQLERLGDTEDLVRRFAEFYPGDSGLNYELAWVLWKLGKHGNARERLETILMFSPDHDASKQLLQLLDQEQA